MPLPAECGGDAAAPGGRRRSESRVSPIDLPALLAHPVCAGYGWGPGPWILVFPFLWLLLIGFLVLGFARRRAWGYQPPWAGRPYGSAPDPVSVLAE